MTGFVLPALSLGVGSIVLKPNTRGFLPDTGSLIIPQATIEEIHHDEIMITDQPVETGSNISDHAYKLPSEVVIRFGFSNSPSLNVGGLVGSALTFNATTILNPIVGAGQATEQTIQSVLTGNAIDQVKSIYQQLLDLQASFVPFTVYTGKRKYQNMLFKAITVTTDIKSENALIATVTCRQIIFANTQTITVPLAANNQSQSIPQSTSTTQDIGTKSLSSAPGYKP
jgi:hypothetical protein